MIKVKLYFYKERFKNTVEKYELTEEQLRSSGHPMACIKLSNEDSNRNLILTMEEDELVSFLTYIKMKG